MRTNSLTVPAVMESLPAVATFVVAAAEAGGLSPQANYRLRLAVDEFATNIATHAYAGLAVGPIDLRVAMDEKTLRVIVEDAGTPFDPRQVAPPCDLHLPCEQRRIGGLGVYLALQGVDQFFYERVEGRNRNVFVMNRPPAART